MPPWRLVHPRRRVAGPRLGRQRLHHHRAERGQVHVAGQLVTVAGRARRRHDRVATARPIRRAVRQIAGGLDAGPHSIELRADLGVDAPVVLLQAADLEGVAGPVGHAVGRGQAGGRRGEQRHPVGPGRGADVGAVGAWPAAPRAVDHQLDLPAGDELDRVGPAGLAQLGHHRGHRRCRASRRWAAVPEVAAMVKPSSTNCAAARTPMALSRSASDRNTVPSPAGGSRPRAGSWRRPARR